MTGPDEVKSGGVMVFQAGSGELPNVLQYLNFSRHTGKLEVDSKQLLAERGIVCFREGEVYYARLGPARGIEAIVDMIAFKTAEAVFFGGEKVEARNVDIPTRDLILQVAVEADRKAAEDAAESAGADDEEFLIPAKPGSRVGVRKGRARPVGAGTSPEREFSGRLTVFMVILAAVAVIVNSIWVASELRDSSIRRRTAREQAALQEQRREAERQRIEKVNGLLKQAVEAYKDNRLEAGEALLDDVLAVDPGNEDALTLQSRISEARSLVDLVPLRAAATVRERDLNSLLKTPPFAEEAKMAERILAEAQVSFEHRDYASAVDRYNSYINAVDSMTERREQYELALASHNQIEKLERKARQVQAETFAAEIMTLARERVTAGDEAFAAGDYAAAGTDWLQAVKFYGEATEAATVLSDLQASQAHYEHLLGEMQEEVLARFMRGEWDEIQEIARQAGQLADARQFIKATAAWRRAAEKLGPAWKVANKERQAEVYREQTARGREAYAAQDWAVAVDAFGQVLALEEHKSDKEINRLYRQARYEALKKEAEQLAGQGKWADLKSTAAEMARLRPGDASAKESLATAENMLLPRIRFSLSAGNRPVPQAEVTVAGDESVREDVLVFRLQPGGQYTFSVSAAPVGDVYYQPIEVKYSAPQTGTETVELALERVSVPKPGTAWTVPSLNIQLIPVPAGDFEMGSTKRGEESPVHPVTISRPFWIASTETTNAQFRAFLATTEYDGREDARPGYLRHFAGESDVPAGDEFPVCYISWRNASAFCRWLTVREHKGGRLPEGYFYRLPTEAEWEYCCRAGETGDYAGEPLRMAWHGRRSPNNQRVARLKANAWMIYDMHGNVWEMCRDWYGPYEDEKATDPAGPETGYFKVLRGGSWRDSIDQCRSSYRSQIAPKEPRNNVGFRVVLAPRIE